MPNCQLHHLFIADFWDLITAVTQWLALVVGHTCVQGLITDVSKSKSKVLRAQSNAELEELEEESCVPHSYIPLL